MDKADEHFVLEEPIGGYNELKDFTSLVCWKDARELKLFLKDHLISCHDLEYINQKQFDQGIQLIEKAKITLNGFINYIKKRKNEKK